PRFCSRRFNSSPHAAPVCAGNGKVGVPMRVVICEHPGPPGVLRVVERPIPEPGPREVLVAVAYSAITFVETQVRAGIVPMNADDGSTFPLVLGNGVAGTVVKVGTGVDPRWIGEKVVTSTAGAGGDRKSTRLNSSHVKISYAVFCLK